MARHKNARWIDCATEGQLNNPGSKHYKCCYYCGYVPEHTCSYNNCNNEVEELGDECRNCYEDSLTNSNHV